jgi:F-box and WD-40 domain protein 1/11
MPYLTFSMLLTSSHYKRQYDKEGNVIPTYITISPQKDGITAKTKCINPARSSSFIPLKRKLKKSSSNFTAILPKLRVRGGPHRRRSSSLYLSDDSSTDIPSHITGNVMMKLLFF